MSTNYEGYLKYMLKNIKKLSLPGVVMALVLGAGSVAFALPAQAGAHAPSTQTSANANSGSGQVNAHAVSGQANAQVHLAAAQLKACQNRQNAINNIMTRIDERAKNQIALFTTIATRVENFYTTQGKTLNNYAQLVTAVNNAKSQADTDFATMQSTGTFSCTLNNPKGIVTAFQGYLKTEISDLQSYRLAVKNLIVGVASANGVTLPVSNASQGGQQ